GGLTNVIWSPKSQNGERAGGGRDAEDEDQARGGEARQAHGLREAPARRRVEAAQAREEASVAPPASPRGQADRQSGRAPSQGARALSLIWKDGKHATG